MSEVAAAIAALRGGRPVRIGALTVLSVETATDAILDLLDPNNDASILISQERAAALNLANERDAAAGPALVARSTWLDRDTVRALADGGQDFSRMLAGPLKVEPLRNAKEAAAAMMLTRLAGLLPALRLIEADAAAETTVDDVQASARAPRADIIARARLPVEELEGAQIAVFRAPADGSEHVALMIGAPGGKPPLVRLHSECLTGDVFGSLKCDCGPQLREALRLIAADGGGILLYLRQEGRGIGLANKIRAYALQDRGLDTVEANRRLGFADDERDYGLAAAMLRGLNVDSVRLLTNNPAKVRGLHEAGIKVVERVSHHMPANPHNADYLEVKRRKSGHLD